MKKLSRQELRKLISESMLPGRLPIGNRQPWDEKIDLPGRQPWDEDEMYNPSSPFGNFNLDVSADVVKTIAATDIKEIHRAVKAGEDFKIPLFGEIYNSVKRFLQTKEDLPNVTIEENVSMLNEVHPMLIKLAPWALGSLVTIIGLAIFKNCNVTLKGTVSQEHKMGGKDGPGRKDEVSGELVIKSNKGNDLTEK